MFASWKRHCTIMLIALISAFSFAGAPAALAAGEVTLYTPYTDIVVSPGETVNYSVDVINNGTTVQNVGFSLEGASADWETKLTAGGWKVQQLSVKPGDTRTVSLEVKVPLQVDKGDYRLTLNALDQGALPLTLRVAEQGSYKTEFKADQPNMEGNSDSTFTYSLNLSNSTPDKKTYALTATAERGWDVSFRADGKSVSSVDVEAGQSKSISVEVLPPQQIAAGSYKIPVKAASGSEAADLELEAVVKGSYKLELTTPTGLLSTDVTAGGSRTIDLDVKNTGSAELTDLKLSANAPINWTVEFDQPTIRRLGAGESQTVKATIKAAGKAIAGDYVTSMTVSTPESSANAQFRVAVKTSLLWGWIGVLIIAAVIYFVYYLFRKYGRR